MSLSTMVQCEYCKRLFTDKGLTRHINQKHPSATEEEMYRTKKIYSQADMDAAIKEAKETVSSRDRDPFWCR